MSKLNKLIITIRIITYLVLPNTIINYLVLTTIINIDLIVWRWIFLILRKSMIRIRLTIWKVDILRWRFIVKVIILRRIILRIFTPLIRNYFKGLMIIWLILRGLMIIWVILRGIWLIFLFKLFLAGVMRALAKTHQKNKVTFRQIRRWVPLLRLIVATGAVSQREGAIDQTKL